MATVRAIGSTPCAGEKPREKVVIRTVTVTEKPAETPKAVENPKPPEEPKPSPNERTGRRAPPVRR